MEKDREKNSAPPHRRAQKVMIRSSSDSSYMSGSPGGSPSSGGEQPPSDLEVSTHSPSLPLGPEPGVPPRASSRPPQESPPLPESQGGHPPLRLKKSFEILVRKPTSSKPKPPPRKYFKSDSDPQKSLEEREDSLRPSGHTLPTCGQVRVVSDGLSVLPRQAGLIVSIRRALAMGEGGFSSIREKRLGSSLGPTAEGEV